MGGARSRRFPGTMRSEPLRAGQTGICHARPKGKRPTFAGALIPDATTCRCISVSNVISEGVLRRILRPGRE